MKLNILYLLLIFCCFQACGDDKATTTTSSVEIPKTASKEDKIVYLREPVNIVASSGEDYPKTLKDIDFPVLPNAEVTNVGNSDIENGTVIMQMETLSAVEDIKNFYKQKMPKDKWEEQEMKIFNGADGALNFQSNAYTARVLIINDKIQDFRKVAVTLNKKVNYEEVLEKSRSNQ